jgi:hypothetical protein
MPSEGREKHRASCCPRSQRLLLLGAIRISRPYPADCGLSRITTAIRARLDSARATRAKRDPQYLAEALSLYASQTRSKPSRSPIAALGARPQDVNPIRVLNLSAPHILEREPTRGSQLLPGQTVREKISEDGAKANSRSLRVRNRSPDPLGGFPAVG